jgi:hypothetical protein
VLVVRCTRGLQINCGTRMKKEISIPRSLCSWACYILNFFRQTTNQVPLQCCHQYPELTSLHLLPQCIRSSQPSETYPLSKWLPPILLPRTQGPPDVQRTHQWSLGWHVEFQELPTLATFGKSWSSVKICNARCQRIGTTQTPSTTRREQTRARYGCEDRDIG